MSCSQFMGVDCKIESFFTKNCKKIMTASVLMGVVLIAALSLKLLDANIAFALVM